jgi:hypothetical protein
MIEKIKNWFFENAARSVIALFSLLFITSLLLLNIPEENGGISGVGGDVGAGGVAEQDAGAQKEVPIYEKSRLKSADGKVEAVVVESFYGATSTTSSHIVIVPAGSKITNLDVELAVFSCDHDANLQVKWRANKELLISYDHARIFNYSNFWSREKVEQWNYVVEIFLKPSSSKHQLSEDDRLPYR